MKKSLKKFHRATVYRMITALEELRGSCVLPKEHEKKEKAKFALKLPSRQLQCVLVLGHQCRIVQDSKRQVTPWVRHRGT